VRGILIVDFTEYAGYGFNTFLERKLHTLLVMTLEVIFLPERITAVFPLLFDFSLFSCFLPIAH
jgi:hypothetical protein